MREQPSRLLGPLESEVMALLWRSGRAMSVREVLEELNASRRPALAYTTVMTVLTRLAEKDVLKRTPEGRGYIYEPVVPNAAALAVRGVMRDYGEAALAHFVDQARDDPELLARLERLMEQQ